MRYFAQLNGQYTVCQVIVAEDINWILENLGGAWVETYENTPGKNFAGIGYTYHPIEDNFSDPKPYESWTLDSNLIWQPPTPRPDNINNYEWDEANQKWISYN